MSSLSTTSNAYVKSGRILHLSQYSAFKIEKNVSLCFPPETLPFLHSRKKQIQENPNPFPSPDHFTVALICVGERFLSYLSKKLRLFLEHHSKTVCSGRNKLLLSNSHYSVQLAWLGICSRLFRTAEVRNVHPLLPL